MTAFGLVLIPLCLAVCFRPLACLQLVLIASIFEAAAALAFGGVGLQPAMLPSAIFSGFIMLQILLGVQYSGQNEVWRPLLPMAMFTAWALAGSIVMPHLFEGQVSVNPQKMEPPFAAILLNPGVPRFNQNLYLVVDFTVLVFVALFTSGRTIHPLKVLNAYFLSGYLAIAFGLWQLANKTLGVPFPESFFYSNPGWAIHSGQQIGIVPRISGTFSEPAAFAGFMVSIVCSTGWMTLNGRTKPYVRILLAAALTLVLLSTSTTGYAVLAIVAVAVSGYALLRGTRHLQRQVVRVAVIFSVLLGVAGLTTTAFFPALNEAAALVFTKTMDKEDSDSYQERSAADRDSLDLAVQTYGLGAGWGSNRSSSLIPGILGNAGVIGVLCLVWFGFSVTALLARARRVMSNPDDIMVVRGAIGAILGILIAAFLSGPSITSVFFYILIGLLIGTSARSLSQARSRSAVAARRHRAAIFVPGSR
jgi:hypothetical protein